MPTAEEHEAAARAMTDEQLRAAGMTDQQLETELLKGKTIDELLDTPFIPAPPPSAPEMPEPAPSGPPAEATPPPADGGSGKGSTDYGDGSCGGFEPKDDEQSED